MRLTTFVSPPHSDFFLPVVLSHGQRDVLEVFLWTVFSAAWPRWFPVRVEVDDQVQPVRRDVHHSALTKRAPMLHTSANLRS